MHNPMKVTPMRNLKTLLATTTFVAAAAVSGAHADESTGGFTCSRNLSGNRVCSANLVSGTLTVAGPVRLENCNENLSLFRQSSAASNTSTSIAVGPTTDTSVTAAASATASTTASRTDITTGGQCYVWASITPVAGATETTRVRFIERRNTTIRYE